MPITTNPPIMETTADTIHTINKSMGDGSALIMMDGTIKMPLPMILPTTIPRQLMKESWYELDGCRKL